MEEVVGANTVFLARWNPHQTPRERIVHSERTITRMHENCHSVLPLVEACPNDVHETWSSTQWRHQHDLLTPCVGVRDDRQTLQQKNLPATSAAATAQLSSTLCRLWMGCERVTHLSTKGECDGTASFAIYLRTNEVPVVARLCLCLCPTTIERLMIVLDNVWLLFFFLLWKRFRHSNLYRILEKKSYVSWFLL